MMLRLVVVALCAAAMVRVAAAQHPLVTLPLTDPAYAQLDGLARQGCLAARISPFRPYFVGHIREAIGASLLEPRCRGRILDALRARFVGREAADTAGVRVGALVSLAAVGLHAGTVRPLWKDVRPAGEGEEPVVGTARVRLTWGGGPRVLAVSEALAKTGVRNDPLNREAPFRRTSGVVGFEDTYLSGQLGRVVVSLGRVREAWLGEGDESLVLSAHGPAFDRLLITARFSRLELRTLFATLNGVELTQALDSIPDVDRQRWNRFLVGHAVAWRPWRSVELTVGETGVLQRRGFTVELAYINPLMLYQTTQHDQREAGSGDANLTAFAGLRATRGRATFAGELLIDDLQIDAEDRAVYPHQLGWSLTGTYALPLGVPASVGVQYRHLDSYTYVGQKAYSKVYQNYDQPLGSELGPDADHARVFGELWPRGDLRLSGGLARWRHGARRLDERPVENRRGHADDPFPSTDPDRPAVQRAWLADVSAEWLNPIVPITLRVEGARIEAPANQTVDARTVGRVQLLGSIRYRYP